MQNYTKFCCRNASKLWRVSSTRKTNKMPIFRFLTTSTMPDDIDADQPSSAYDLLYPGHIPSSTFQKILLSVGSAAITITNPHRGDMLATFGEASGHLALERMKKRMEADETGRQILLEKPRINSSTVNLSELELLPEGTFGKVYSTWLKNNRAHPDERLPVHFVDDPELAYVMTRYREIHDLCHTVLGMETNMIGEVTVKVFEGLQTGLPMCVTGGIFGTLRLGPKHIRLYFDTHFQWVIRQGLQAKSMMNVYFEKHWEQSIEDFRHELNIDTPPKTPMKKKFV